jgi:hypothetical protein
VQALANSYVQLSVVRINTNRTSSNNGRTGVKRAYAVIVVAVVQE